MTNYMYNLRYMFRLTQCRRHYTV